MDKKITKRIGILAFLLVPVLFYLFFVGFGKNHFDLPYYGPNSGVSLEGDTVYYKVPTSLSNNQITIVFTVDDSEKKNIEKSNQVSRLNNWYENKYLINFVIIDENSLMQNKDLQSLFGGIRVFNNKKNKSDLFIENQVFTMGKTSFESSEAFVLIDKQNHIRGYYDGTNSAELNRLKEEISVLIANE